MTISSVSIDSHNPESTATHCSSCLWIHCNWYSGSLDCLHNCSCSWNYSSFLRITVWVVSPSSICSGISIDSNPTIVYSHCLKSTVITAECSWYRNCFPSSSSGRFPECPCRTTSIIILIAIQIIISSHYYYYSLYVDWRRPQVWLFLIETQLVQVSKQKHKIEELTGGSQEHLVQTIWRLS